MPKFVNFYILWNVFMVIVESITNKMHIFWSLLSFIIQYWYRENKLVQCYVCLYLFLVKYHQRWILSWNVFKRDWSIDNRNIAKWFPITWKAIAFPTRWSFSPLHLFCNISVVRLEEKFLCSRLSDHLIWIHWTFLWGHHKLKILWLLPEHLDEIHQRM